MITRHCQWCQKTFKTRHPKQKYCEFGCRWERSKSPHRINSFGETVEQARARYKRQASDRQKQARWTERQEKDIGKSLLFPRTFIAFDNLVRRTLGK